VPRAKREGDDLSYLAAKHSLQAISGVLLLSTRPETGIGRFLALLIVICNAAGRRGEIASGFLLAFTDVQSAHRAAEFGRVAACVQDLPRATVATWASYRVIGDAR